MTINEVKDKFYEYKKQFIEEDINKQLMFLREIDVYWSISIIETESTKYSVITPEFNYQLVFELASRKNGKSRKVTIFDFEVLTNDVNVISILKDNTFNWDYNKLGNYFI